MNVQVTSVSKKEQKLAKTGAAIFVITQEDIRRSGATNIPDLLRMVPGVDVARVDHSTWAVSIRGFNNVYANKVLVLIDGRSVYHPAYSGVLWYAQDVPLEDIERIEVIRGPGGTVWGANAMNGVINIITKSAKDTPGDSSPPAADRICKPKGWFSTEARSAQSGDYRVYGRYSNQGKSDPATFAQPADSRRLQEGRIPLGLASFPAGSADGPGRISASRRRTDHNWSRPSRCRRSWELSANRSGTTTGIFWRAGRIRIANGSDISLQAYFDQSHVFANGAHDWASIGNIDFQHHLRIGSRNDVVWGLSYRADANRFAGNSLVTLQPAAAHRLAL